MTKITIETCYGTVSVSSDKDDLNIDELIDLIRRAIIGAGYSPEVVREYFQE